MPRDDPKQMTHWDKLWDVRRVPGPTMQIAPCQEAVSTGNDHPISGAMLVLGRAKFFFPGIPETEKTIKNYHEIHGGADCNLGVARTPFHTINGRNPLVVNVCTFACAS